MAFLKIFLDGQYKTLFSNYLQTRFIPLFPSPHHLYKYRAMPIRLPD